MATGGSLRHDDLRNTPVGRFEIILPDDRSFRAISTRSAETKTVPRHFVCSSLGVSDERDGWLEATLDLLREQHGDQHAVRGSHEGKRSQRS